MSIFSSLLELIKIWSLNSDNHPSECQIKATQVKGGKCFFVVPVWKIQLLAIHMFSTFLWFRLKRITSKNRRGGDSSKNHCWFKFKIKIWDISLDDLHQNPPVFPSVLAWSHVKNNVNSALFCPWSLQINFRLIMINRAGERKALAIPKV